jgi:hypothetical protein
MDWGREGRIHKVLHEDGCSSTYRAIVVWLPIWKKLAMNECHEFFNMLLACYYDYLVSLNWITILTIVYFHRLKINHDSHEFILESGTVANNTVQDLWKNKWQTNIGSVNLFVLLKVELKGMVARDIKPLGFSLISPAWAPESHLNIFSNSQRRANQNLFSCGLIARRNLFEGSDNYSIFSKLLPFSHLKVHSHEIVEHFFFHPIINLVPWFKP